MLGLTVIYIPNEGANLSLDEAAKDKDLVKRLEGVVVHWTKQIKMCLGDQKQSAPNELLRPVDEYDFWIYRCKKNCSLFCLSKFFNFFRMINN